MQDWSRFRLTADQVRFSVSETEIEQSENGHKPSDIIGQPRAVEALQLATAIWAKGYNVYAAGPSGTGKRTTIMRILEHLDFRPERLREIVLVNNFQVPDRPYVLYFNKGQAVAFRKRMRKLVEDLHERIRSVADRPPYRNERDKIMLATEGRETQALADFEQRLATDGFSIVQVDDESDQRSDIAPIVDGEVGSFEDLQSQVSKGTLSEEDWNNIRRKYYQYMDEMNQIFQSLRVERADAEHRLQSIQRDAIEPVIRELLQEVRQEFDCDTLDTYLEELVVDVLDNIGLFLREDADKEQEYQTELLRYGVNVLVDHSNTDRTPVIFESHPDYQKLFGSQDVNPELEGRFGFLTLRSGSLLQASGGYLILRAEDVVSQEEIWNALKRALQDEVTEIRTPMVPYGLPMQNVKPEPIEVNVKVILMGNETIYDVLFYNDEEFGKLFKVLSEFDSTMENTKDTRHRYLQFMHMIREDERLLPLGSSGKAAVIEYGVRLSEFRNKLSTRFSLVADLLRESNHWAVLAGREHIDREAVEKARDVRRFLHNLPEEKFDEQISSGEMVLEVAGRRIGCINGLSVLDRGYYAFGRPMLITARVAPGTDGIINIERESGLSGELHDKGIYIIQGFLQATYATDFPLSINASIGFEQSYVEIDGDSASSTEIYALLSAIGNIPLRQEFAATGSVNQFGQIQPVGGISEKIEGFYATCKLQGLTGEQGVIIPKTNVENLILSAEVQAAVEQGEFHIYAIDTVDQGIEILTGKPAGERRTNGHFPPGTVNGLVERRLREMARQVKEFSSD